MTSHRNIPLTLTLLAVFVAFAPSSALADSLLSGYGGPGEGNQAILGSALVGGAGGGGSSNGSSGSSGGSTGSTGSTGSSSKDLSGGVTSGGAGEAVSTGASGRGASSGADGRAVGRGTSSRSTHGQASGGAPRAYTTPSRDDASQTASVGSQALGLSAADLAYVLLALGALGVTGLLTRRLAHAPVGGEGL
jgi:hypothetical protein